MNSFAAVFLKLRGALFKQRLWLGQAENEVGSSFRILLLRC